ncbi:MAG TPA: F0F1 ATP synthase subunit B [Syntrophomonadaceae bacterium]|nr:F0F1 ATP synthase subunit B [Syntrophomonadaceae bacterium]
MEGIFVEFTWYEFTWAIINFLVILAILYKFFYNPVIKFLDNRSDEIRRNISEAEQARAEAEAVLEEYRNKLAGAKQEAQEIVARATRVGEEARAALLEQSRAEAAALLEKAHQEIQRERDDALKTLRQEVASLAVMAAEKILGRTVTKEDHTKMVDQFLDEVGEVH